VPPVQQLNFRAPSSAGERPSQAHRPAQSGLETNPTFARFFGTPANDLNGPLSNVTLDSGLRPKDHVTLSELGRIHEAF
jgi:hypothetical protein